MIFPEPTENTNEDYKKYPLYQKHVERDNSIPDISKYSWYIQNLEEAKKIIVQIGGTLCD